MSDLLKRIKLSKYPSSVWLGKANGQEIIDLIEQQQVRIAELEATVERLCEQLSAMAAQRQCGCGHPVCNRCRDDVDNRDVLQTTPQQNLAEHDTGMIEKFVHKLVEVGVVESIENEATGDSYLCVVGILCFAKEYAQRIKDSE